LNLIFISASLKENTGEEICMVTSSLLMRSMIIELSTSCCFSSAGSLLAIEIEVKKEKNKVNNTRDFFIFFSWFCDCGRKYRLILNRFERNLDKWPKITVKQAKKKASDQLIDLTLLGMLLWE
jgi:hypothetical protein